MPYNGTPAYLLTGEARLRWIEKCREVNRGTRNPFYGKHHSLAAKRQISKANSAEGNGLWRGDNVGYAALHQWVRSRLPKPDKCQKCREKPPIDLANKSGKYERSLDNWWWICRSCHMRIDGRIFNLKQYSPPTPDLPPAVDAWEIKE